MYDHKEFERFLDQQISKVSPSHNFQEVLKYTVLPAGKLFRPQLVLTTAKDLGEIQHNHLLLASAVEVHHAYTLIHDDLPAMDDDDERRGRPSSHIKFSQWEAILAGDALLNSSYEILADIDSKYLPSILKSFTQYCGPKGLILGQVKDLGMENKTISEILEIHELKTSRLIQCCLTNCAVLSDRKDLIGELNQLGLSLGLNFQLLDDLCELTEPINEHEKEINPFLHFNQKELLEIITKNNDQIFSITQKHKLYSLENYILHYLNKSKDKIKNGHSSIKEHVEINLDFL